MQAEGVYSGPGGKKTQSSDVEYYDKEIFDALMATFYDTADKLVIHKTIFEKGPSAEGTELMVELSAELRKMRKMTNRYRTFMTVEINGLIKDCLENINSAENISGDSVGVMQK